MDEKGNYLIERHPLHYLSAGRDLIRLKDQETSGSGLAAFGDPDYDAPAALRLDGRYEALPISSPVVEQGNAVNLRSGCGSFRDISVSRLVNTREEVESITGFWKQDYRWEPAVIYTDNRASEENFKTNSLGKRVIHLATHGYFIQNECVPKQQGKGHVTTYSGENPLLLSGLFLAGANLHGDGTEDEQAEDGIVTALEVSAMDLKGTDLVVLSACETGLGEVRQGEGVYGLRRAFQLAGARTVVSALWRVPDSETKALMKTLYAQKATTYPELMQQAALQHIHNFRIIGRPTHPYSWGGFVAMGDWRRK
jgi:CHAT domain-containing protein